MSGDENENREEGLGILGVFVGHYGGSGWEMGNLREKLTGGGKEIH